MRQTAPTLLLRRWPHRVAHRPDTSSGGNRTMDQLLEVAQSMLAAEHQPALIEEARAQAALHRLAQHNILLLHLIDKLHEVALFFRANGIDKAVFVDGERAMWVNWNDEVERDVARPWIDIHHEVRPEE